MLFANFTWLGLTDLYLIRILYRIRIWTLIISLSFHQLQLVRSNSRCFMPSQADEEVHQLSYLQKHLANILSLLADFVEGEGKESLVCYSYFNCHTLFVLIFGTFVFVININILGVSVCMGVGGRDK